MKILRAIGHFFAKIWNWIKNTAWIQPLLIVGIIFGVIFSIPSISSWIQGMVNDANSSTAFYKNYKKSLSGKETSPVDKLLQNILDRMNGKTEEKIGGDKFFLCFVAEECPNCEKARPGFEKLKANWNGDLSPASSANGFKMISIFTDETTKDTEDDKNSAFQQLLDRKSHFFELASGVGFNSQYYLNGKLSESDLMALESASTTDFLTPTILLIDFTEDAPEKGISEVMFGVTGSDAFEKAELLLHCWDHSNEFSSGYSAN